MDRDRQALLIMSTFILTAGILIGTAIGSAYSRVSNQKTQDESIKIGTTIELRYPTGGTVTGVNGAHPQPEYRMVKLRVARVNSDGQFTLGSPFRVRIGNTTYYAVEE